MFNFPLPRLNLCLLCGVIVLITSSLTAQSGLQRPVEEKVYSTPEVMPVLTTCGEEESQEARQTCTNNGIMQHIVDNLTYPKEAKDKGLEGAVVVEFIVGKKGALHSIQVIQSLGPLDIAASKVVATLPEFIPGTNNGIPVSVKYQLPIRFTLTP